MRKSSRSACGRTNPAASTRPISRPNPEGVRYNGDWEIWVQELDLRQMKLVGESMAIWKGAVKGVIWPEGPHLYKIDGYYYLMHAEGGTGPEHSISIARSKKLFQWFEGCPRNPIFTHRNLGKNYPVIYAGHGDLVEDGKGNWYVVMLASRPCSGLQTCGRKDISGKRDFSGESHMGKWMAGDCRRRRASGRYIGTAHKGIPFSRGSKQYFRSYQFLGEKTGQTAGKCRRNL